MMAGSNDANSRSQTVARQIDLVAFDVDGTLVSHPQGKVIWQLLMERFEPERGLDRERYDAYLANQITYAEWVDLDIGGWAERGATRAEMVAAIEEELQLTPGAREVVAGLAERGYRLAIISGTLDIVLDVLFPDHPFDQVFTNRIEFDGAGEISGWRATPFDMEGKRAGLAAVAAEMGTTPERCAFVGDHVNDLSALGLAGLAIAYDPKDEAVRRAADLVVESGDLARLLEILG